MPADVLEQGSRPYRLDVLEFHLTAVAHLFVNDVLDCLPLTEDIETNDWPNVANDWLGIHRLTELTLRIRRTNQQVVNCDFS